MKPPEKKWPHANAAGQQPARPTTPARTPTHAHQIKPAVAQSKSAAPANARPHPVAPPVYRPQAKPPVAQHKAAQLPPPKTPPVAPPAYRSQPVPKCTQTKGTVGQAPAARHGTRSAFSPSPGARPPGTARVVTTAGKPQAAQLKANAKPPLGPRPYTPPVRPQPVQAKTAQPFGSAVAAAGRVIQCAADTKEKAPAKKSHGESDAENAKQAIAWMDENRKKKDAAAAGDVKHGGKVKTKVEYEILDESVRDQKIPSGRAMYLIPLAQLPEAVRTQINTIRTTDEVVRTNIRSAYRNESRDLPVIPIDNFMLYGKDVDYKAYAADFKAAGGDTPQYIEYTIHCYELGGAARLLYDYYYERFYVTVTHYNAYMSKYGDDKVRNAFYRVI